MLLRLLTAPITAPMSGLRFILEQIGEMAERELYDLERIREELLLLQLAREEGEIGEEEYAAREAEVLARLRTARAYWQGGASGPVRITAHVVDAFPDAPDTP